MSDSTSPYFAESSALISGIPEYTKIELNPQTPQGTKILSYNLFLNITEGSPFVEFEDDITLNWYLYYNSTYYHANNSISYPNSYVHYYQPELGVKVPEREVSTYINLTGSIEELFPLSNTEIVQCSWRNSTFIKVPVGMYLLSPYLYHLGIFAVYSDIYVGNNYKSAYLGMETNAGKKSCNNSMNATLYSSAIVKCS